MGTVEKVILLIICSVIDFRTIAGAEKNYGTCQTADGKSGDCIPIQSCTALYSLAMNPNLKNDELIFLRKSQCGKAGQNPLVCCPKPVVSSRSNASTKEKTTDKACETPNGIKGNCISALECDSLVPLIKDNISPTESSFLTASKCGVGFAQVCCPDPIHSDRGELPLPPNCGRISLTKRIVGGTATDIDEFPWTVLIKYSKDNGMVRLSCGGSLINERYVVTAAHCASKQIVPATWRLTGVRLGEWNTETERDCQKDNRGNSLCASPHIDVSVDEQIIHPLYNGRTQANDIALLRLEEKVNYNDFVRPICLPVDTKLNFENATMDIAGWGQTETGSNSKVKLKALVRVKNMENCKQIYRTNGRIELGDTQMCAGGDNRMDTCRGDSGGPLMHPQKFNELESYILIGVVSFGPTPCGLEGFPGVYTRVASFVNWIKATIKK